MEWCADRVYGFVSWLNDLHENHFLWLHGPLWFISFLVTLWLESKVGTWTADALHIDEQTQLGKIAVGVIHDVTISFFVSLIVLLIVRLVPMAQKARAMKALGIVYASVTEGDIHELLGSCLEQHQPTETIRVVCISGKSLFGNEDSDSDDLPLRRWALDGRLEVLMPNPSSQNPTIRHRWSTYKKEARTEYPDREALVREVQRGRDFLLKHGNSVTEHRSLCIWRVVMVHDFCLVQNYFPNITGSVSDHAPTFVYTNAGKYSYYQTFAEIFRLLQHVERDRERVEQRKRRRAEGDVLPT